MADTNDRDIRIFNGPRRLEKSMHMLEGIVRGVTLDRRLTGKCAASARMASVIIRIPASLGRHLAAAMLYNGLKDERAFSPIELLKDAIHTE